MSNKQETRSETLNRCHRAERILYRTPLHGVILIPPLLFEFVIIGAGAMLSFMDSARLPMSYIWTLASAFLALDFVYGLSLYINLNRASIELTSRKVTSHRGSFYGQTASIDLDQIEAIDSRSGRFGRLLGFGSVVIKDVIGQVTEFRLVPNPYKLQYELIMLKPGRLGKAAVCGAL